MRPLPLTALALLCACSSVDPRALARLAALDPLAADPAQIAVRLSLPEGLRVPPGGAVLTLASSRSDTGQALDGRFVLAQAGGVWRVAPQDLAALRDAQARARAWELEAPRAHSGSLSVSLTGCLSGDGPAPDAPVAAEISTDGGANFVPLLRGVRAAEILRASATAKAPRACPE